MRRNALKNLSLFLSLLYPKYDPISIELFDSYLSINPLNNINKKHLQEVIQSKRKHRETDLNKVFKTNEKFQAQSGLKHFQVVARKKNSDALQEFLAQPDQYIYSGDAFKRGKTNTISVITLPDNQKVFVKRYQSTKGMIHKMVRGFMTSRARNAWYCAHLLKKILGVDTPEPIALLEHKFGRFVYCSYLVTEYIEAEDALTYFSRQSQVTEEIRKQANKLLELLTALESGWVFHGDMKANNFMLTPERMMIIDLDQTIICSNKKQYLALHPKDASRFKKNWTGNPIAQELFSSAFNS